MARRVQSPRARLPGRAVQGALLGKVHRRRPPVVGWCRGDRVRERGCAWPTPTRANAWSTSSGTCLYLAASTAAARSLIEEHGAGKAWAAIASRSRAATVTVSSEAKAVSSAAGWFPTRGSTTGPSRASSSMGAAQASTPWAGNQALPIGESNHRPDLNRLPPDPANEFESAGSLPALTPAIAAAAPPWT